MNYEAKKAIYMQKHISGIELELAAIEIAADLMSAGYCNAMIGETMVEIDWNDFLIYIDESDQWGVLAEKKSKLFDVFCKDLAQYRVRFLQLNREVEYQK